MKSARAGQIVFGRYLLERELARGGMSSVWVATDRKLKREVAIKLMAPDYAASDTARRRFEREAMTVAKLQSPHVVQIYDYGIDHRTPFIVMELLAGEDLRTRLKRVRRIPLPLMAPLVLQASKGLAEAHAVGLVHRDMKPANIFLVRTQAEELVKILDFGVAKAQQPEEIDEKELTQEGSLVGTPQYMSPEQIRCLELDFRSDLWSLGVIIYRALTGKLPFRGKTPADLGVNICSADYATATSVAPDLPPGVDMFMAQALARDIDDRFGSAKEMATAFFSIAPGAQPSLSMPAPRHEPLYFESGPGSMPGPPSVPSMASWPTAQSHPTAPSLPTGSGPPSYPSGSYPGASYPSATGPSSVTAITGISGSGTYPTAASGVPISVPPASISGPHSGSLASAMLDESALAVQPSNKRRNTVLGVAAVLLLLGGVGVASLLVGGDEPTPGAPTDGSSDVAAEPPPSASEPDGDETTAAETTADNEPEKEADAEVIISSSEPAKKPAPRRRKAAPRKTPPKPPPGGDDWDPFKSRK